MITTTCHHMSASLLKRASRQRSSAFLYGFDADRPKHWVKTTFSTIVISHNVWAAREKQMLREMHDPRVQNAEIWHVRTWMSDISMTRSNMLKVCSNDKRLLTKSTWTSTTNERVPTRSPESAAPQRREGSTNNKHTYPNMTRKQDQKQFWDWTKVLQIGGESTPKKKNRHSATMSGWLQVHSSPLEPSNCSQMFPKTIAANDKLTTQHTPSRRGKKLTLGTLCNSTLITAQVSDQRGPSRHAQPPHASRRHVQINMIRLRWLPHRHTPPPRSHILRLHHAIRRKTEKFSHPPIG